MCAVHAGWITSYGCACTSVLSFVTEGEFYLKFHEDVKRTNTKTSHGMSHCVAFGCTYRAKGSNRSDVNLHVFPKDEKLRKIWEDACGRVHFPPEPQLCSRHFTPDAFRRLVTDFLGAGYVRELKPEAVPTIFSYKKYVRPLSCCEDNLRKVGIIPPVWRTPFTVLFMGKPGTDSVLPSVGGNCHSKTDASTQTETVQTVDAAVQCPEDVNYDVFRDHTYAKRILVDLNLLSKRSLQTAMEVCSNISASHLRVFLPSIRINFIGATVNVCIVSLV